MRSNVNIAVLHGAGDVPPRFSDVLAPESRCIFHISDISDIAEICPHVVIMYGMPPEKITELRKLHSMPVMFIAERADEFTVVRALSRGADAVVPRDISDIEFFARVKALLRRAENPMISLISREDTSPKRISCGDLTVDTASRSVLIGGRLIKTTVTEYGIIEYLMKNLGRVCTAEEIYNFAWKGKAYSVKKTVVEHIRRIRRKIEPDPKHPLYIQAVFGIGYIMGRDIDMEKTA